MLRILLPALLGLLALAGALLLARRLRRGGASTTPESRSQAGAAKSGHAPHDAGVSLALPADPLIAHYRLERVLGKGAMGVVYQGRDEVDKRLVALKTLALTQACSPEEMSDTRARFFREAETAGRLKHPGIVEIHEAGETSTADGSSVAYIAMAYVDGGSLQAYTGSDALLPVAHVLDLVAQIAEALDYAHARQVVHRDVKPANVLVDRASGRVQVSDFGVARLLDASRTRTGLVLGTPSYMSPEQLTGQKVDGRSDLFSLGVMLFQLLSGRLPFVGDSLGQLMLRITQAPTPDVRAVPGRGAQLADAVVAIVARALQKDVNLRYQTGAEMAQDLRKYLSTALPRGAQQAPGNNAGR